MITEFIKFTSSDQAIMHGILFKPNNISNKAIIHVHGLAGNFYENDFVLEMSNRYTDLGFNFFVFNNRGHDYISDIAKVSGDTFKGGGAYEYFEDCIFDLLGARNYLNGIGISNHILQGHSSGCNKIIYTLFKSNNLKHLLGLILLSPCDDIGVMETFLKDKFAKGLNQAHEYVKQNTPLKFIDEDKTFYPMSAKTYLDMYVSGNSHDIFHYRNTDLPFTPLNNLTVPILVCFGNNGEYTIDTPEATLNLLRAEIGKNFNGVIIDGASHNYASRTQELVNSVCDWLTQSL